MACVYAMRAKGGAPFISMPIAWDDLQNLDPALVAHEQTLTELRGFFRAT